MCCMSSRLYENKTSSAYMSIKINSCMCVCFWERGRERKKEDWLVLKVCHNPWAWQRRDRYMLHNILPHTMIFVGLLQSDELLSYCLLLSQTSTLKDKGRLSLNMWRILYISVLTARWLYNWNDPPIYHEFYPKHLMDYSCGTALVSFERANMEFCWSGTFGYLGHDHEFVSATCYFE